MSTFARTNFPTNINTVEKFFVHTATLLEKLNPNLRQNEDDNVVEKAVQIVTKTNADGVPIMIIRATIPLNSNYQATTGAVWEQALELSNTAVPTAWTTGS